jgi:hypothetical protein
LASHNTGKNKPNLLESHRASVRDGFKLLENGSAQAWWEFLKHNSGPNGSTLTIQPNEKTEFSQPLYLIPRLT